MNHDIHGERDGMLPDASRQFQFRLLSACAGDVVRVDLVGILEAELDVIQARGD